MSALVLDAGALIAIDRGDHAMHARLERAAREGEGVRTNAIAQVWRGGGRQARLAKALRDVTIEPIARDDGMRAGELLGVTGTRDAIDASVALLAKPGDRLYTSDAGDLRALCEGAGNKAVVVGC
jgi:hypothetical protein